MVGHVNPTDPVTRLINKAIHRKKRSVVYLCLWTVTHLGNGKNLIVSEETVRRQKQNLQIIRRRSRE
ncbi:hypothetical protein DPEC_G00315640 [Dallia pectoralis]|uniref:Uncharacterized protein n=1 Tax=Dallia pectoralis TaxID=75939 RepID=A0ACC2FCC1_DALPE|nr:hypothetical protein DPEC_G00315640 [Dallia pectoralis]